MVSVNSLSRAIKLDPLPSLPVVAKLDTLAVKLSLIFDNGIWRSNLKLISVVNSSVLILEAVKWRDFISYSLPNVKDTSKFSSKCVKLALPVKITEFVTSLPVIKAGVNVSLEPLNCLLK